MASSQPTFPEPLCKRAPLVIFSILLTFPPRSLYWTKVYYPNMEHLRQIGGSKRVKGTSIAKELFKTTYSAVSVALVLYYLVSRRSSVLQYLHKFRGLLTRTGQGMLAETRNLVGVGK
jgi:flagellar biosynthesis protein FlhB